MLPVSKLIAVCAALVATTVASVGMNLDDLQVRRSSDLPPVEAPLGADPRAVDVVVVPAAPGPDVGEGLLAEADAVLERLAAARTAADLDEDLAGRIRALASEARALDESADAALVSDLKVKLQAALALLVSLETADAAEAATLDGLVADVKAALRVCATLLLRMGVGSGAAVEADTLLALVHDLEKRVEYANGNVWTLRDAKAQSLALLALVADLEATGALAADLAESLQARLGAVLRICITLLLEIEVGGGCDASCREPAAPCDDGCGETPVTTQPEPEPDATPPTQDPPCTTCNATPRPTDETPPCATDCSTPPCESACAGPCACPPPPCGCEDGDDGITLEVDAAVGLVLDAAAEGDAAPVVAAATTRLHARLAGL